jgi:hypothetical protein
MINLLILIIQLSVLTYLIWDVFFKKERIAFIDVSGSMTNRQMITAIDKAKLRGITRGALINDTIPEIKDLDLLEKEIQSEFPNYGYGPTSFAFIQKLSKDIRPVIYTDGWIYDGAFSVRNWIYDGKKIEVHII